MKILFRYRQCDIALVFILIESMNKFRLPYNFAVGQQVCFYKLLIKKGLILWENLE